MDIGGFNMKKRLISLTSMFLILGILGTSASAHANGVTLISPKDKTVTTSNVVLVSGKGKRGTNLKIDAYLANLLRNQKIDLNNPPKGGYVLILSEGVKIGASGNFARELTLAKGLNKIQVKVVNAPNSQTRYVYITDLNRARAELSSVNNARFTSIIKSLM